MQGNLYSCFFNIQEQNNIFTKTGSHANLCKTCWGFDSHVTFRQDYAAIHAKTYLDMIKMHQTMQF